LLVVIEVFFSFLVLFTLVAASTYYAGNYRQPLGFSYESVWNISIGSLFEEGITESSETGHGEKIRLMIRTLPDFPEVEAVAAVSMSPFRVGTSQNWAEYKDRGADTRVTDVTDDFKEVMGLELVLGRWFEQADDAAHYDPVVITQRLRNELFGEEDPLGKTIPRRKGEKDRRVIGVITDFRHYGEFHPPINYCFRRSSVAALDGRRMRNLVVKVRPGTTAAFEERLMKRLRAIFPQRTFQIEPLSKARRSHMNWVLVPLSAGGLVAGFMIIMVGLGMVGVLWQNVARRTREIGLRRALGATAGGIHAQILGELLVVATIGLAVGTAVVIQIPLLELVGWLSMWVCVISLGISLATMYLLTIAAGLYPSRLATKVQPAAALHYE
jgi:putative ABC transport system permease protein